MSNRFSMKVLVALAAAMILGMPATGKAEFDYFSGFGDRGYERPKPKRSDPRRNRAPVQKNRTNVTQETNVTQKTKVQQSTKVGVGVGVDVDQVGGTQVVSVNTPRDFLDIPGFMTLPDAIPPFKPEGFINAPSLLIPLKLTFKEADDCRKSAISDSWEGKSTKQSEEIELLYPQFDQKFRDSLEAARVNVQSYHGTAKSHADDDYSFIAVVCEAAYRAMEEGAQFGVVQFAVRPTTKYRGIVFGPTAGMSGQPNGASANPYGAAGGFSGGVGLSETFVDGILLVHITTFSKKSEAAGTKQ